MATCDVNPVRQRIEVHTNWVERDLIRMVPGSKWDSGNKLWHVPLSWGSCLALRGVFGDRLEIAEGLYDWANAERVSRIDPANALRTLTDLPGLPVTDERLYPFQVVGSSFLTWANQAILADEMGTGKSAQIISRIKTDPENTLPALIICPNSVKRNWADESDLWKSGAVPYVIHGPAGKRRKMFEEAAEDPDALVIINLEAVRIHSKLAPYGSVRLLRCIGCGGDPDPTSDKPMVTESRCEVHLKELNHIAFKTVVVDEAHRLKDAKSKQTRACWAVGHGPTVKYRYALTGTPVAEHVGDLWPILHFLQPQEWPTRKAYIDRWCLLGWNAFGAMEVIGLRPDTRDEFFKIFNPRFRRMPKSLVLSHLPPKVYQRREVDLGTKQGKMYREMEDDLITWTPEGYRVVATSNLTATTRMMQLAQANLEVLDEDKVRLVNPSPKLDALEEIADELEGKQFVVCAEYRQLIDLAADRLRKKIGAENVVLITGEVPEGIRAANLAMFQGGRARVLLFTVKAGGVGLNMTAADTIVRLQRSWSMLENKQALDRVHRIGSEIHESILVIDVIARDTIEEDQLQRLYVKQRRLDEITRDRDQLLALGKHAEAAALDAEELALLGSDLTGREELGI